MGEKGAKRVVTGALPQPPATDPCLGSHGITSVSILLGPSGFGPADQLSAAPAPWSHGILPFYPWASGASDWGVLQEETFALGNTHHRCHCVPKPYGLPGLVPQLIHLCTLIPSPGPEST